MNSSRHAALAAMLGLFLAAPADLPGQAHRAAGASWVTALPALASPAEDRARVEQILGRAPLDGFLLRSPSSIAAPLGEGPGPRLSVVAPHLDAAWNSDLPFSLNDGALWAGRGLSTRLVLGLRAEEGPITVVLAPELAYSENLGFQTLPPADSARSLYSSPWHVGAHSADLPLRFGDARIVELLPGQSSLTLSVGGAALGASTENQWWGPGTRNAIVLSSHAAGIPHVFLRTARPVRTPLGALEARWIAGALSESLFFDTVSANDTRALSGFVATLRPALEPDLTLGVARVVYSSVDRPGAVAERALDALTWWHRPELTLPDSVLEAGDFVDPGTPGRDQILSLFARWVFPDDGFEVYGEWARTILPTSLRDLLADPGHTLGYTLGLQWAGPVAGETLLRLQGEASDLEESASVLHRPGKSWYVSRSIEHGYTHRGQVVGAAAGPGGSSQWLAADLLAPRWQAGLFAGRNRWENDVYYTEPGRIYAAHDVSVYGGVRAGVRAMGTLVTAEVSRAHRFNYLFQNPEREPWGNNAVDVWSTGLRLTVTPERLPAR